MIEKSIKRISSINMTTMTIVDHHRRISIKIKKYTNITASLRGKKKWNKWKLNIALLIRRPWDVANNKTNGSGVNRKRKTILNKLSKKPSINRSRPTIRRDSNRPASTPKTTHMEWLEMSSVRGRRHTTRINIMRSYVNKCNNRSRRNAPKTSCPKRNIVSIWTN
jgi:hypothetical protein